MPVALQERAAAGRRRPGASGPALVQATFGRWPKIPSRLTSFGAHEPVRQRVQPQVGIGCRGGRRVEIDLDRRRRRPSRARRSSATASLSSSSGAIGGSRPSGHAARARGRGTTCRGPSRPPPSWRGRRPTPIARRLMRSTVPAAGDAGARLAIDSQDAGARSVRDIRRPHPNDLRHPERLRRRDAARRRDPGGRPRPAASRDLPRRRHDRRAHEPRPRAARRDRRPHRHRADQRQPADARYRDRTASRSLWGAAPST